MVAEARHQARHDLRRQRDLWHEHDDPAAVGEHRRGRLEVDLGLARPGDAVQQQPLARRRRHDRPQRRGLVGRQLGLCPRGADGHVQRRAAHDARGDAHEPAPLQAPQRGEVAGGEARQRGEQGALAVAQALLRVRVAGHLRPQGGLRARALWGQQQRKRARRRRAVLGGHPQREVDELGGQARLEHAARRDRIVLGAVGHPRDHADHVAMAEGNHEHRAHVDALRAQVVERPAQRAGRRERLYLNYRWHRIPR